MVAELGCWHRLESSLCLARAGDRTQIPFESVEVDTSGKDKGLRACWFPSFLWGCCSGAQAAQLREVLIKKFGKVGFATCHGFKC